MAASGGIPGAIASTAGSILDFFSARNANRANKAMAHDANIFSAQQAATSWQRGVADMKKAGVNPMLAVSQGGASSPMGVVGAPQRPVTEHTAGTAMAAANNLMMQRQVASSIAVNEAQARNIDASTALTAAKTPKEQLYAKGYSALNRIVDNISSTAKHAVSNVKTGFSFGHFKRPSGSYFKSDPGKLNLSRFGY